MHELSMVMRLADTAENTAVANDMGEVEKIYVGLGEMSTAIAEYVEKYFDSVKDKYPHIRNAKLEITEEKAEGLCKKCGESFLLTANDGICPKCGERDFTITKGRSLTVNRIEGN